MSTNYDSTTDPIYGPLHLDSSLRQTRMTILQKSEWGDSITCQLEVLQLDEQREYEAVSYVWGKDEEHTRKPITLNGIDHKVSLNLYAALRRLRSTTEDRTLWVDAICINQNDKKERGEQVAQMKRIYKQSKGVLVWLGNAHQIAPTANRGPETPCIWRTVYSPDEDKEPSEEDKKKLQKYVKEFKRHYQRPKALRHSLQQDYELGAFCLVSLLAQNKHLRDTDIPFFLAHLEREKIVACLDEIMQQAWWQRQWVVQETILAPKATLFYGRFETPWEMFTIAAKNYKIHSQGCCSDQHAQLPSSIVNRLTHFAQTISDLNDWRQMWWQKPPPHITLLPLLWQYRNRNSGNPMDKVYALIPLVTTWYGEDAMAAHYEWPVQNVFREVVVQMVHVDSNLNVLMGNAEKTDKFKTILPSWVPDWTNSPHAYEIERLERVSVKQLSGGYAYNASGNREPRAKFIGPSVLLLNGIPHDVVTAVGECMPIDDDVSAKPVFREWEEIANVDKPELSSKKRYVSGCLLHEAYWRTLCMDTVYASKEKDTDNLPVNRRNYEPADADYGEEIDAWLNDSTDSPSLTYEDDVKLRRLKKKSRTRTFASDHTNGTDIEANNYAVDIDHAVATATTDRRLFSTSKGYIGLGPKGMKLGDVVYVLDGGKTPFLLRPVGSKDIPRVNKGKNGQRECHELVGDCYVHGIMQGEVLHRATKEVYLV